jgi:hypothetical protein
VYVESLSVGKDPSRPEANEDRVVCYAQRTFAVIDGETDKSGHLIGGRSGGWHAGWALESELRTLDDEGALAGAETEYVLARLEAAIASAYERFGIAEAAGADPNRRFAASMALAHVTPLAIRLVLVGDCGIRANAERVWHRPHPLDAVMSHLRRLVFETLGELHPDLGLERRLDLSRAYTVEGLAEPPQQAIGTAVESLHPTLADRVLTGLLERHGEHGGDLVRTVGLGGLRGVARLRGAGLPEQSQGVLDGFGVSSELVQEVRLDTSAVRSLELFSDGYFGWPPRASVADWERHHAEVERRDPHRIGPFASTKGSRGGVFADDRTVLIVREELPKR